MGGLYSPEVIQLLNFSGSFALVDNLFLIALFMLVLYFIACIGLFFYQPWARVLFFIIVTFNITLGGVFFGVGITYYLSASIGYVLTLSEGAVLYMLLQTEIRDKFISNKRMVK